MKKSKFTSSITLPNTSNQKTHRLPANLRFSSALNLRFSRQTFGFRFGLSFGLRLGLAPFLLSFFRQKACQMVNVIMATILIAMLYRPLTC